MLSFVCIIHIEPGEARTSWVCHYDGREATTSWQSHDLAEVHIFDLRPDI